MTRSRLLLFTTALALSAAALAQGWGKFGLTKKVTVRRLLPPSANLHNTRIRVTAIAQGGVQQPVVDVLLTKVKTLIQSDSRFIFDEKNPETNLKFTVTRYYVEPKTVNYGNQGNCTYFIGRLEASYTATVIATGVARDSANLVVTHPSSDKEETTKGGGPKWNPLRGVMPGNHMASACGNQGAPSANAAQDALMDELVQDLGQRAAPVEDALELPVPGGKLGSLSVLAEQQRWSALAEEAEKAPKLDKADEDSFRQYLIGLANEALAYNMSIAAGKAVKEAQGNPIPAEVTKALTRDKEFRGEALKFAQKAVLAYSEAMKQKPSEKEFTVAQGRAEKAQSLLLAIDRREKQLGQMTQTPRPPVTVSGGGVVEGPRSIPVQQAQPVQPPPPAPVSADSELLEMCRSNVPVDLMTEWVQENRAKLTFSPANAKGLIDLSKACGANTTTLRNAMRPPGAKPPAAVPSKPVATPAVKPNPAAAPVKK